MFTVIMYIRERLQKLNKEKYRVEYLICILEQFSNRIVPNFERLDLVHRECNWLRHVSVL